MLSGGTQIGATVPVGKDKSSFAGHEIDLRVSYQGLPHVKLESGYARFIAGSFQSWQ